jgi:hypothetical protein
MNCELPTDRIAELCDVDSVEVVESIQSLWSGYGEIVRVRLLPQNKTIVVKHVFPPEDRDHKYGWAGDVSHQRKLSSYENELAWYRSAAAICRDSCRMAKLIASESDDNHWLFVLEDLDAAGFPVRRNRIDDAQLNACLHWLANLHASFLTDSESAAVEHGLWPTGTYWHLATRPDELSAMPNGDLKSAASAIDRRLSEARFQTIVHGDAKLANFCFADSDEVAAVDFQYVGGGCGMKDFAYFISSCFSDGECEQREASLLNRYFDHLRVAINDDEKSKAVESEWRSLYPFAWADFYRFLAGWSPGHWKMHRYSERMARLAIEQL